MEKVSDFTVEATGIEDVLKRLNDLPDKIQTKILRKSIKDISTELLLALSVNVPVGKTKSNASQKYGSLRDSLAATSIRLQKGELNVKIRGNFWWRFLEFGTKDRWTGKKRKNRKAATKAFRGRLSDERRFLNPVMQDKLPTILDKVINSIRTEISRLK